MAGQANGDAREPLRRDHSDAFKIAAVKRYLAEKGEKSGRAIADELGIVDGLIYRWAKDPRFRPEDPKPPQFADSIKRKAVKRAASVGAKKVAEEYGVSAGTVYAWAKDPRFAEVTGVPTRKKTSRKKSSRKKSTRKSPANSGLSVLDRIEELERTVADLQYQLGLDG